MDPKESALRLMAVVDDRDRKYGVVNAALQKLNPDFPLQVRTLDDEIYAAMVDLLDSVLGDCNASYYLNEARMMKDGGAVEVDGKRWPIRTVDDVRAYINRNI